MLVARHRCDSREDGSPGRGSVPRALPALRRRWVQSERSSQEPAGHHQGQVGSKVTGEGRLGLSLGGLVPEVPEASPAVSGHVPSAAPMPSATPPPPTTPHPRPWDRGAGLPEVRKPCSPSAQGVGSGTRHTLINHPDSWGRRPTTP